MKTKIVCSFDYGNNNKNICVVPLDKISVIRFKNNEKYSLYFYYRFSFFTYIFFIFRECPLAWKVTHIHSRDLLCPNIPTNIWKNEIYIPQVLKKYVVRTQHPLDITHLDAVRRLIQTKRFHPSASTKRAQLSVATTTVRSTDLFNVMSSPESMLIRQD